jgi:hypothetical protein
MTDDERNDELVEETIEDLEAPAWTQDVAGGANTCATPTCVGGTKVSTYCERPTCTFTAHNCYDNTKTVIVYAQ